MSTKSPPSRVDLPSSDLPRLELEDDDGTFRLYELELWPTNEALQWQETLVKLGLEPMGLALSEDMETDSAEGAPRVVLARTLASKLDALGLAKTLRALCSNVYFVGEVNGQRARQRLRDEALWNSHFRGRTMDVYRIVGWVLRENLRDFINAGRSFGGALQTIWLSVSGLLKVAEGVAAGMEAPATSSDPPSSIPSTEMEPTASSS